MNISAKQFKNAWDLKKDDSESIFINVCTPAEYKEAHIEGVINIPLDELKSHLNELADKREIYIHCRSGNRSGKAVELIKKSGIKADIFEMQGGLLAWEEMNFPIKSVTNRIPIIRQVMIVAGLLIIVGVLLAQFVHPLFIYLPVVVGLGLLISGISGWCGMALVLAKMPWNK